MFSRLSEGNGHCWTSHEWNEAQDVVLRAGQSLLYRHSCKLRDTTVYNYYFKEYGNITIGLGRLLILYYTLLCKIIISDKNENVLV